jgi:hypothetical protein
VSPEEIPARILTENFCFLSGSHNTVQIGFLRQLCQSCNLFFRAA